MTDEVNANLNHSKLLLRTLRNTFPCLLGLVYLAPLLQLRKLTRWTQPPVPALSTQRELLCSFCCLENSLQHRWSLKLNTWVLGGKKEQRTGRYKSNRTEHRSQARQRQAKLLIGQVLPWLQGPAPSSVKHTQTEQSRTRAERAPASSVFSDPQRSVVLGRGVRGRCCAGDKGTTLPWPPNGGSSLTWSPETSRQFSVPRRLPEHHHYWDKVLFFAMLTKIKFNI